MNTDVPYPSLADFAATWQDRSHDESPPYAHPAPASGLASLEQLGVRRQIEDVLDTVVALQRATWLEEGVYVGPKAVGMVYRTVLECARTLRIAVPPAILSGCGLDAQGTFGTDRRAFLHLSSYFFKPASDGERRFIAGRLCGHIHADQVTWGTLYAVMVDHAGLRRLARQGLGPTLEIVLAPLSVGVRLALSRWHRAAEITADRAGLICAGDLNVAGAALLRIALGGEAEIRPTDYLEQSRNLRGSSPGRWTEVLSSRPWLHKRLRALELFANSETYHSLGGKPGEADPLTDQELKEQTDLLLQVK